MSAEIINLRRARKRRQRDADNAKAGESRALSGRSKIERTADQTRRERAQAHLDGHALEHGPDGGRRVDRAPDDDEPA